MLFFEVKIPEFESDLKIRHSNESDSEKLRFVLEQTEKNMMASINDIEYIKNKSYSMLNFIIAILSGLIGLVISNIEILFSTHNSLILSIVVITISLVISLVFLIKNIQIGKYRSLGNTPENLYNETVLGHTINEMIEDQIIHYDTDLNKNEYVAKVIAKNLNWAIYAQIIGVFMGFLVYVLPQIFPAIWRSVGYILRGFC